MDAVDRSEHYGRGRPAKIHNCVSRLMEPQRLAAFHVCFLMNDGRRSTSVLVMK